ncbi:3'-5' exonuclease [Neomicrococcus lactis]|uniref:DNA 3'-5' helicase n=1 Tax=Neomicrococcus lactis TaxID=732241 RepID=A0A7W8YBU0_9MICC|nr:3'-5' exonuclease [Neomicrococcus lactis]MBB5598658.1 superfamily I DNA/RNA helicase [Neomicrococcus lactis]
MPFVSMASAKNKLDGSVQKLAMSFLQKLQVDDTAPGLHIEPMKQPRDPRARTGRVNDMYRAVLFKLESDGEPHYVYVGTWPHDEAIDIARSRVLKFNLALGAPEVEDRGLIDEAPVEPQPTYVPPTPPQPEVSEERQPSGGVVLEWTNHLRENWTQERLESEAGISADGARRALAATTQAELSEVIDALPEMQGLAILGLANGDELADVLDELGAQPAGSVQDPQDDALLDKAIRESKGQFVFVGDNPDELREAFESLDFDKWRVFLHPEQRKYVETATSGPYRLTGGAGTGKTVVLLHRARSLYRANPNARILLTTYTRALAKSLSLQLTRLDSSLPQVEMGKPGITIAGMDQIAAQVLRDAPASALEAATASVLGPGRNTLSVKLGRVDEDFEEAVDMASPELPEPLLQPRFLDQEYQSVVLANGVVEEKDYVRASRSGRGTALNRGARQELWKVFAQFRLSHRMKDAATFPEIAAIAAAVLRAGGSLPFDHVLVDEAQDFSAPHWLLLRALVAEGADDLFIAEDSHQRIYGQKVPMSRFGINIRGRSRRLRLNYRTTAENLAYAMSLLSGAEYSDLDDEKVAESGYRSVRSGPTPSVLTVSDSAAEVDVVVSRIREWMSAGVAPEAIAVLVRSEKNATRAVDGLTRVGIPSSVATGGSVAGKGKVTVMTMHSSKGLEFQCVVVMGAGAGDLPAKWTFEGLPEAEQSDALLRERSLLYVAATRARDELVITASGEPSELVRR